MPAPGRHPVVLVLALSAIICSSDRSGSGQGTGVATERAPGLMVDFAAVLADGTPVADLQASEVEIRLNNRTRKIVSLRRIAAAPAPDRGTAPVGGGLPPPYGTNDSVAAGRSFALILDEESFVSGREDQVRGAVEGLLEQLTPADRALVAALPYGGIKVPFTNDRARIRMAALSLTGHGSRTETGSAMASRTRALLESLDGFLQTQAGRQAPLTVVLFTAGLAAPRRDAPMSMAPGQGELLFDHFKRVGSTAGAARAAFYIVQPSDIGMSASGWRENIAGVGFLGSDNPQDGIEQLAGATGAARLPLDASGTSSLVRVARETSAYYSAEIEPERGEIYRRSRPVAIKIARGGVTVRSRPEITFVERRQTSGKTRLAVTSLLASSDAFPDVRLRAAGFTVRDPGGDLRVGVVVEAADASAPLSSVGAALVTLDGRVVANWFAADAAKRPLLGAMAAPPGAYRLRVAAIDSAGRAGVAEELVEAALTTVGPLALGSLMLGVAGAGGIEPRLEFGAEPAAIGWFDIYGGAAGMRLAATLEVARDATGPALATSPLVLSRAGDARVVATGTLPIGALSPGDYSVRAVIQLDDGTTGRVVRTLRKLGVGSN